MELVQRTDLGITTPDSFYCKVWGFRYSHSLMLIRASKGDLLTGETIYLMFGEVHYFEGPTNWKGAGFHFGGREEIISLIQRMQELSETILSEDALLNTSKLYKFGTDPVHVRILADILYRSEEIPEEFA